MFGSTEARCIETIVSFIKDNPRFRPVTLEDEGQLFLDLDVMHTFMIVKGSYKSKDVLLGMLLDYDITTGSKSGTGISIFYRVSCSPPVSVTFTRENDDNQVTKRIGPEPEVEVGDDDIDSAFIIMSENPGKVKKVLTGTSLREFLLTHTSVLERLTLNPGRLDLIITYTLDHAGPDVIQNDLDGLVEAAMGMQGEGETRL